MPYFIQVDNATDLAASLPNVASMIGVPTGNLFAGFWIKRYPLLFLSHKTLSNTSSTNSYKIITIIAVTCMALLYLIIFIR